MTGSPDIVRYGPDDEQYVELWHPLGDGGRLAGVVVVLIHGGFWRARYDASLMHPLATDLVGRGAAAVNLEYRRVGSNRGDPLATLEDVRAGYEAAIDALGEVAGPVVIVGHSAGGHLARRRRGNSCVRDRPGRGRGPLRRSRRPAG